MAATVKGGFWETNGVSSLATIHTTSALRRIASQALGRDQMYGFREIMETLTGAAAGGTATKTLARVVAAEELGGARAIESESLVNRATTAADATDIIADILSLSTKTTFGSSPPANLDGNPLGTR